MKKAIQAYPDQTPLVAIDEVQRVPELMDLAQYLIDEGLAQFILAGSSLAKLRRQDVNLLPGRVALHHLDTLMLAEMPNLPPLETLLTHGSPPAMLFDNHPSEDLSSYVRTYLEEEVRAEALVHHLGKRSINPIF